MGRTGNTRQRLMDAAHELIWGFSYGSVTIEAICDRARVKKGSFYYFFDSKVDLAVAAIETWRDSRELLMKEIFQREISPLERITKYLDVVAQSQIQTYETTGQVLGCPVFTLGSEICTQNEQLRLLIHGMMTTLSDYFELAIGDAQASGEIEGNNAALKARLLWAFYEGTLTRARIENNPELIRNLSSDALELIGSRRISALIS
jgi:TetR/AcrR family transcriptional repressor of nem operon